MPKLNDSHADINRQEVQAKNFPKIPAPKPLFRARDHAAKDLPLIQEMGVMADARPFGTSAAENRPKSSANPPGGNAFESSYSVRLDDSWILQQPRGLTIKGDGVQHSLSLKSRSISITDTKGCKSTQSTLADDDPKFAEALSSMITHIKTVMNKTDSLEQKRMFTGTYRTLTGFYRQIET